MANFILPPDSYDLNIDPNKRSIFLHSEGNLLEALREALDSFCQPFRSTFSASQISCVPDNLTSPSLTMTLIQPTSSKRKHLTVQPLDQAPEIDQTDSCTKESQLDDGSGATNLKRPKLNDILTPCRDVNIELAAHDASTSNFVLSKPPISNPICDTPPDKSQTSVDDEASSRNSGHKQSSFISSSIIDEGSERLQKIPPSNPNSPGLESNTSNIKAIPETSLEKPDWVPSRLRTDSPGRTTGKLVQKTLDTSSASWNTKGTIIVPSKTGASRKKKAMSSSERMRNNIQQFIRGGHVKPGLSQNSEGNDDVPESEHDQLSEADTEHVSVDDVDKQISEDQLDSESDAQVAHETLEECKDVTSCDDIDDPVNVVASDVCITRSSHTEDATALDCQLSNSRARRVVREKEIIPTRDPAVIKASIDLERIIKVWETFKYDRSSKHMGKTRCGSPGLQGAGLDHSEIEAEYTLSRIVQKNDFENMQIIGQFNLGFIIVRRRDQQNSEDDLFIVDQHASDEKFNFEKLQRETKLTAQRLLVPKVLDLTVAEEITAMDHLDMLEFNGFSVQIDEAAKVGRRVQLLAQPVSGNTSWDVSDLEELLHLIDERGSNEVVRPSKTRRMMASRACRMSTMIGDGLTAKQMFQIVKQMGTMDQPWACPHGRPTMRWLARCDENSRRFDPRYHISDWIVDKIEF